MQAIVILALGEYTVHVYAGISMSVHITCNALFIYSKNIVVSQQQHHDKTDKEEYNNI